MEIIIIIAIIAFIMIFLGGGLPFPMAMDSHQLAQKLHSNQWHCEEVVWTAAPVMLGGNFHGTMEVNCEFEALRGEGIVGLRKYMIANLPANAEKIHSGPHIESFQGLPSNRWDMTLRMSDDNESVLIRGNTQIATDGFTQLRNVFESSFIPATGKAKYLKSIRTEVNVVKAEQPGWYRVKLSNSNKVEKPWFASAETFRRTLVEKSSEEFESKAARVVNDLANQL